MDKCPKASADPLRMYAFGGNLQNLLASQEFGNDFKNGSSKVGKLYTVMYL
jgi:hypothetical protein